MIDYFKQHFKFYFCLVSVAVVSLCGLFSMDSHAQEVDGKYQYCVTTFEDYAKQGSSNSTTIKTSFFESPYEIVGTFVSSPYGGYELRLFIKDPNTNRIYSGPQSNQNPSDFFDFFYSVNISYCVNADVKETIYYYDSYNLYNGFGNIFSTSSDTNSKQVSSLNFVVSSFRNGIEYYNGTEYILDFDPCFDDSGELLPGCRYKNNRVWTGGTLTNFNANQNGMKIFKNAQYCVNYLNNPTSSNIVGLVCPDNRIYKSESMKVQIEDSKSLMLGIPADFTAQKVSVFKMGVEPIISQPSVHSTFLKDAQVVCSWNGDTENYEDIFVDFYYEYHMISAESNVTLLNYIDGIPVPDDSVWKHWSGLTRCGVVSASEGGFKLSLLNLGMYSDWTETPNGTYVMVDKISIYARLRDKNNNYGVFVRCDMKTQTLNEDLTVVTLTTGRPSFSHDAYKVDETGYTHTTKPGSAPAVPGGSGGTVDIPDFNDIGGLTSQYSDLLIEATSFPKLFSEVFYFLPPSLITIIVLGIGIIIVIRILGR